MQSTDRSCGARPHGRPGRTTWRRFPPDQPATGATDLSAYRRRNSRLWDARASSAPDVHQARSLSRGGRRILPRPPGEQPSLWHRRSLPSGHEERRDHRIRRDRVWCAPVTSGVLAPAIAVGARSAPNAVTREGAGTSLRCALCRSLGCRRFGIRHARCVEGSSSDVAEAERCRDSPGAAARTLAGGPSALPRKGEV
jgi:hypothetical protein